MKKTTKFISLCLAVIMMALAALPLTAFAAESNSSTSHKTQTLAVSNRTLHSTADNSGYYASNANKVSVFPSGHSRLGTLSVTGDIAKKTYKGTEAYAVYGSSIVFEYKQSVSDKTYADKNWHLSSDTSTSVNGTTTGTIDDGAIVIYKSYDGSNWTKAATSVDINGETVKYTVGGSDIGKGVYLKFVSVAEVYYTYQSGTHKEWVFWPFKKKTVIDYANHYDNLIQQSIVYVASDTAAIGLYSGSTDAHDVSADVDLKDISPEAIDVLKKGTTLTHGSVSHDFIRVDKLGNSSFTVTCRYNDGQAFSVSDKKVFKDPGKYSLTVSTRFGSTVTKDVYIMQCGKDLGYSQYFGNGLLDHDHRVFDQNSPLPTYTSGVTLSISPKSYAPALYGSIIRFEDATHVESDTYETVHTLKAQTSAMTLTLDKPGIYSADLYAGDPTACGNIIRYSFLFTVVEGGDAEGHTACVGGKRRVLIKDQIRFKGRPLLCRGGQRKSQRKHYLHSQHRFLCHGQH